MQSSGKSAILELCKNLGVSKNDVAWDIGVGDPTLSLYLLQYCRTVVSCDNQREVIKSIAENCLFESSSSSSSSSSLSSSKTTSSSLSSSSSSSSKTTSSKDLIKSSSSLSSSQSPANFNLISEFEEITTASPSLLSKRRANISEGEIKYVMDYFKNAKPDDLSTKITLGTRRGKCYLDKDDELYISDFVKLKGTEWLNGNVINFYLNMLERRDEQLRLSTNSFKNRSIYMTLMDKLRDESENSATLLKRWTRTTDIFSMDKVMK